MKFFVDAQLPLQLCTFLTSKGFDTIHTESLSLRDRTPDTEIRILVDKEERILITKDFDFINSYRLLNSPKKLLFVTTGNIHNRDLLSLFEKNIVYIIEGFASYDLLELSREELITHN
jgi:predicted nuclease of predicted toxin-antitoxin system